jgi:hypothetical protein
MLPPKGGKKEGRDLRRHFPFAQRGTWRFFQRASVPTEQRTKFLILKNFTITLSPSKQRSKYWTFMAHSFPEINNNFRKSTQLPENILSYNLIQFNHFLNFIILNI